MSTGFGKDGVQKGSAAANIQGNIGNVDKNSDFAKLQSHGARGGKWEAKAQLSTCVNSVPALCSIVNVFLCKPWK